jgi:hypothetical protein
MKFSILNRQIVYFDQSHATLQNLKDARLPISRQSEKLSDSLHTSADVA